MNRAAHAVFVATVMLLTSASAHAQDPGSSEVDPLYGYFVAGLLGIGAIFVLCKSSRRSA